MTIQNSKLTSLKIIAKQYLNFDFCILNFALEEKNGIALLLVILLLSAILSISLGIFNLIFGQIQISGEIGDSFRAFMAADEGTEKMLYRDRIIRDVCRFGPGTRCETLALICLPSSSGYAIVVSKVDLDNPPDGIIDTDIKSVGQYKCPTNPNRLIKRAYEATY
jgi:hypothetical protein